MYVTNVEFLNALGVIVFGFVIMPEIPFIQMMLENEPMQIGFTTAHVH